MTSNNNNYEEKIYVDLKLNKNIARLLKIFANTHAKEGSTEEKRIDNFLSEEVNKIVHELAADPEAPPQKPFPDSLKQHVQRLLNEANSHSSNSSRKKEDFFEMMSIKKRRKINLQSSSSITLRQQLKEPIDIIGYREQQVYRDGCLDDICKVLQQHIDIKIHNWIESFEHHEQKEKEWLDKEKADFVFYDLHHSMKVYSNGAAHGLQFFKDELLK